MQVLLSTMRHSALAVVLSLGIAGGVAWRYALPANSIDNQDLTKAVAHLNAELRDLRQEREMPALVVSRSSGSVCYLYAVYTFEHMGSAHMTAKPMKIHVSGTGFVAAEGWVATNRHVAEPWWGEPHMESLRRQGAKMRLSQLLAFFPGMSAPIELSHITVSPDADLAVAHFDPEAVKRAAAGEQNVPPSLKPLKLADHAPQPGDAVLVLGYPMGIEGMLAKSPRGVTRKLAMEQDDFITARALATMSLIRPSATQGHLGDAVADKLLYDASTAQGASGSPVFNAAGEVVGVNTAFLDGFSGGGIGVAVSKLQPLLRKAAAVNP